MKGILRVLLIASLMVSIGAQWVVLQSAAWVGMVVTYSVNAGSVKQGLSDTFDGQHPCALCKVVEKGQQSEKKGPLAPTAKLKLQLLLFCEPAVVFFSPPTEYQFSVSDNETGARLSSTPPVPPPRGKASFV